ncbi:hypothetical protein ACETU7_34505 [Rhodococcus sp. 3Y1]
MFRPSLGPRGRAVIAVPYVGGPQSDRFLDIVRSWGASVAVMDADRHDRLAAATQVLTHASVLAFGVALAELGFPPTISSRSPLPASGLARAPGACSRRRTGGVLGRTSGQSVRRCDTKALFDATARWTGRPRPSATSRR